MGRDEFPRSVKIALAVRAGHRCCFPGCSQLTAAPRSDDDSKYALIGHAAHITSAAGGGPRRDDSLSPQARKSASNGAWMCNNHGTLVDRDDSQYSDDQIRTWKKEHERRIEEQVRLGLAADATAEKRMLRQIEAKLQGMRTVHRFLSVEVEFLTQIEGHSGVSTAPPAGYRREAAEVRKRVDSRMNEWRDDVDWSVSALDAVGRAAQGGELESILGDTASSLIVYRDAIERLAKDALNRGSKRQSLEDSADWRLAEEESRTLVNAAVSIASFE